MLSVKNLTKYYKTGKSKIIGCENISFQLNKGEITSLLGLNGAGKSTIINCISGNINADKGDIFFDTYSLCGNEIKVKKMLGILYEKNPLYTLMTVDSFLYFCANMRAMEKIKIHDAIKDVIEFCGLEDVSYRIIKTLSKGYKQRIGLAQAILHNPKIIILDEPISGFDSVQTKYFEKKILQISKEKTILFSTHNLAQAAIICSNHILLNKGKIIAQGSLLDIKNQMEDSGCIFENNMEINYKILEQAFQFFAGINKNEFKNTKY